MDKLGPPTQYSAAEIQVLLVGLLLALETGPPESVQEITTGIIDKLADQIYAITGELPDGVTRTPK